MRILNEYSNNKIFSKQLKHFNKINIVYYHLKKFQIEKDNTYFIDKIFNLNITLTNEEKIKTRNILYYMHINGLIKRKEKVLFAILCLGPSKLNRIYFFFQLNYPQECEGNIQWQNQIRYILTSNPIFKNIRSGITSFWNV